MTTDHDAHPTRPTSGPEYWALMARENVAGVESVLAYKFEQVERLQAQVDALEQRIADLEEVLARERSLSDGISDRYSDLEQRIVELEGERLPWMEGYLACKTTEERHAYLHATGSSHNCAAILEERDRG